mmetsp:Transcript_26445/g.82398  ORF Transcript_26445/g.82398 Transcript_26445/m.82398 type:complete len:173 (-) Transcript_26445:33-551(-)
MAAAGGSRVLPSSSRLANDFHRSLHTTKTALGECRLDTVGHLVPCDAGHAQIRPYRSYGEWFEQGKREKEIATSAPIAAMATSPCWPYGQNVTKLYSTFDQRHTIRLDDRHVSKVQPYVPPRSGSLPDLHTTKQGGRRNSEHLDEQYHRGLRPTSRTSSRPSSRPSSRCHER